tara:strand:+ start:2030 stop:2464 length:435 start_codon:yes stop_codon:yes gene_type:complete
MANWSEDHDLVYLFMCVSFLADGEVDDAEKEAMRGNVKVMLPNVSDDDYQTMEDAVLEKFVSLGSDDARKEQYKLSLGAVHSKYDGDDESLFKVVKNLAYIARADDDIHENEVELIETAVNEWKMKDKISLMNTGSSLFVDYNG